MARIALVAGSSGAIGQAICRQLHLIGAKVICGYASNQASAQTLSLELEGEAVELKAGSDLHQTARDIVDRHGRLDIMVNAAGINREGPAAGLKIEEWRSVLDVNLDFAFQLTQAVLPHMLPQAYGRIIHVSSIAGRAGGRGQINYAAAKAALQRMVKVFALEVGRKGVTVNCVAPGVIVSPMSARVRSEYKDELLQHIAARRFGEPIDVAKAVGFLAGEDAAYINGAILPVDGGMLL